MSAALFNTSFSTSFRTNKSQVIYIISDDGRYVGIRNLDQNTFDIMESTIMNNNEIWMQIISIKIPDDKFVELDQKKCILGNKYAAICTSDKICHLIDLPNHSVHKISNQSKIFRVFIDEDYDTIGIVVIHGDKTTVAKIFNIIESDSGLYTEYKGSISEDSKISDIRIIDDIIIVANNDTIEVRSISNLEITKSLTSVREHITNIHWGTNTECIVSGMSGYVYHLDFTEKYDAKIFKNRRTSNKESQTTSL